MIRLAVLTVSTLGYSGQREDTSGKLVQEILCAPKYQCVAYELVSDDRSMISEKLVHWADQALVDLIITNGGTGMGPSDITPEACLDVIDKEVPGLAEAMRAQTLCKTSMAMLSRSVAGIRGSTLIISLPGSPKAVRECLGVVEGVIPHAIALLRGNTSSHPGQVENKPGS